MQVRGRTVTRWIASIVTSLTLTWAVAPQPAVAEQVSLSGRFQVIWGDTYPGSNLDAVQAFAIIDDQGQWTSIALDEALTRPFGGPLALNRKRVTIVGELMSASHNGIGVQSTQAIQARSIELEMPEDAGAAAAEATPSAVTGSQPWVTILCRFGDSTGVTPHDVSFFNTLMGPSYLDRYWRELSYENINLTGSMVVGWYNLPQPRSYYVSDTTGANLGRLEDDCIAVADADVFFPNFAGINLMFNDTLGCCSWGGGAFLNKEGQSKSYGITWIASWGGNQNLLAHEMGHGFGLPHSSGPYGNTYDSSWDVMSNRVGTCASFDPVYDCDAPHTISYHKDKLGWIPPGRKYVATPGSSQTITIERLGQPVSGGNYLMAQIPIGGSSTQFYTVEARRFAGYDVNVPGEAVVIHHVNWGAAQVVDPDGNGDPNDAGAMWTPGETFTDLANAITVSVNSVSSSSFSVTVTLNAHALIITNGPSGSPNPVASGRTVSLSVSAFDSLGHTLSYDWSASCPTLPSSGSFNNPNVQTTTWTAPANTTGSQQTCTMQVTVLDGQGLSHVGSLSQAVDKRRRGLRSRPGR